MTNSKIAIGVSRTPHVDRHDANFDRACDAAHRLALSTFGFDDDGYATYVKGFVRSTDCLVVEFVGYRRTGCRHEYTFSAWIERTEDDDSRL